MGGPNRFHGVGAAVYALRMPTITIRDVPDSVVQGLKRKAAQSGKSLEAYVRDLIVRDVLTLPDVRNGIPIAELMDQLGREASARLSISDVLEAIDGGRQRRW